MTDSFKDR